MQRWNSLQDWTQCKRDILRSRIRQAVIRRICLRGGHIDSIFVNNISRGLDSTVTAFFRITIIGNRR